MQAKDSEKKLRQFKLCLIDQGRARTCNLLIGGEAMGAVHTVACPCGRVVALLSFVVRRDVISPFGRCVRYK